MVPTKIPHLRPKLFPGVALFGGGLGRSPALWVIWWRTANPKATYPKKIKAFQKKGGSKDTLTETNKSWPLKSGPLEKEIPIGKVTIPTGELLV